MGYESQPRGRFSRFCGLVACGAGALAALPAAPADAAVSCAFDSAAETLTINMGADNDQANVRVDAGGTIEVLGVACTNGAATVTTIDDISVIGATGSQRITIQQPAQFAPGTELENGSTEFSEIEFTVVLGAGVFDEIVILGESGPDVWSFGNAGLNAKAGQVGTDDVDVVAAGQPDEWSLSGQGGDDFITGQGGNAAGTAFTGAARLEISGGDNADTLRGGNSTAGDQIEGGNGNDTVTGFDGPDSVGGAPGDNVLDGGPGTDDASFGNADGATVDLNLSGAQATGDGNNTLIGVEGLIGSDSSDTLTGDGGPNTLNGRDGLDLLDGRGGNDTLFDNADGATATYAQSPAGVTVDLTAGTATGGAGNDTITGVNDLIGSPFADSLTGNTLVNSINGLGGNDTVSALAGSDVVDVRDLGPDTASCGAGDDSAIADQASVDSVNADCEGIAFLPEIDPGGSGGGGGEGDPADTGIAFELAGKAKQRVLKQKGVVVRALCPLEECTATASGSAKVPKPERAPLAKLNLKPVTETAEAGVAERITLGLKRKQLRAVAAALRAGKKPKLTVTTTVTDAAGNAASESLTVTAKR